jgi:hypothetical protein
MAVGVQLSELLDELKYEAGISANVAHGIAQRDAYVYMLRRVQKELYTQHQWPFLTIQRDVELAPGQRIYSYPEELEFETIAKAWTRSGDGSAWLDLPHGIDAEHYSTFDSDAGAQSSPARRWQNHADAQNQFEVWPIPFTPGSLVRFQGKKKLGRLVDLTDTCTLDHTLIVLYASSEILARAKSEDAALKLQKAQAHMRMLKIRQGADKGEPFVIGGGSTTAAPRVGLDYIPSGYGKGG